MSQWTTIIIAASVLSSGVSGRAAANEQNDSAKEQSVSLREGTWKDIEKLVRDNEGKVVVVDLWSTSCLPCVKEFPSLVKLQKSHKDNVVCASFNLDYAGIKSKPPAYYRPRVEKFLNEHKAEMHNFISTVEGIEVMDSLKIFSIPAVFVFDQKGKLAKRFDESMLKEGEEEAFTYQEDITPFVDQLLK